MTHNVERLLSPSARRAALASDLREGLSATPRRLSPVWLYDERGSALFDEITRLPEYYPTAREREILEAHADDVIALARCDTLVELGAGSSEKTHLLLDAMASSNSLRAIVALDVSEEILVASTASLHEEYHVPVTALVADFGLHLGDLPAGDRRLFVFLGGTIGNFEPSRRAAFLRELATNMGPTDAFLLGADLVKDRDRLVAAYNDAAGVTAQFNLNVLTVVNREFGADFEPGGFTHVAFFDEEHHWIEMRLRSTKEQRVHVAALDLDLTLNAGDEIRTEVSTKFSVADLVRETTSTGFTTEATFVDREGDFCVLLLRANA